MKKPLNCVVMKRQAQERLRREYAARKDEFSSYAEFITTTANASADIRAFKARVRSVGDTAKV